MSDAKDGRKAEGFVPGSTPTEGTMARLEKNTCEQIADALREEGTQIQKERAQSFVDREKQTFSRYAELFPNYEWTDSATAIDLMAAEIKCLRSELLDACRLATSMREFAKPEYATTRPTEWKNWKKLCARLTALLIEIRARWYGGVL